MPLKAGVSRVCITPEIGTPLAGYFEKRVSQGINDHLYTNALFLHDGSTKVALVSCDLLQMNKEVVQNARTIANKLTGIRGKNILICATHTHTGPVMIDDSAGKRDQRWEESLANSIAEAIYKAKISSTDCQIKIGVGSEDRCVFHRRYRMKDGTAATITWCDNRGVIGPIGPIDPELGVIWIVNAKKQLICVLVNYTNHCDTMGGNTFSADFPGWMGEMIRESEGGQIVTLFTAGAQGNISHVNINEKGNSKSYNVTKEIGSLLATEVLKTLEKAEYIDCHLRVMNKNLSIPVRQYSEQEVKTAKETLRKWRASRFEKIYARKLLSTNNIKEETFDVELQAIALNDTVLIGVPGEMFVELGLAIKKRSPFKHTFIVDLANDQVPGYIATSEAYDDKPSKLGIHNYEVQTTALARGSGEMIVENCLDMIREIKRDN